MRRLVFLLITSALVFTGCSNLSKTDVEILPITASFEMTDHTGQNSVACFAFHDEQLYYVQRYVDNFAIRRVDLKGNETLRFIIPRGNGPGEARHSLGITVNDDGIWFSDYALRRISKFDLEGNYDDCVNFNDDTGMIIFFDIIGNHMYYAGIDTTYAGKINISTGDIDAAIPRKGKTLQEVGSNTSGGIVKCDQYNNEVYVANVGSPYRIERYDADLNPLGEYTYPLESEYDPVKIYPGPNIAGDFTVASMAVTPDYIYAPHISARFMIRNGEYESRDYTPEYFRFSKKTGRLDKIYRIQGLEEINGFSTVIHADDEKLIVYLSGEGEWIKTVLGEDAPEFTRTCAVLKLK